MKWFSLLTVGIISLCSAGFAQSHESKASKPKPTPQYFETVNLPTANYFLTFNAPISWGSVKNNTGVFSLTTDGSTIKVNQAGKYNCTFTYAPCLDKTLIPPDEVILLTGAKVMISYDAINWTRLYYEDPMVNTTINYSFPIQFTKAGYLQLIFDGTSDYPAQNWPVFLKAGQIGLRFTMTSA
jgi:hypothetical protein